MLKINFYEMARLMQKTLESEANGKMETKNNNQDKNRKCWPESWEALCRTADQMFFTQIIKHSKGGCGMEQVMEQTTVNGVDVGRMNTTIEAIQQTPELAKFNFRATNTWISGGHNRSTIKEFYGACQEDTTRIEPFVLDADEPPVLLGKDQGANPVEFVLHSLASCLTTALVYHAAAQGITLETVESKLDGDIDLRGFLGLSHDVRKGYQNINVTFKVKSDADPKQLQDLCKYSPVFDIISNPVPVNVSVEAV